MPGSIWCWYCCSTRVGSAHAHGAIRSVAICGTCNQLAASTCISRKAAGLRCQASEPSTLVTSPGRRCTRSSYTAGRSRHRGKKPGITAGGTTYYRTRPSAEGRWPRPPRAAAALRAYSFRALQRLMRSSFGHAHPRTGSQRRDRRGKRARWERSGAVAERQPVVGGSENGAARRVSRLLLRTLQRAAAISARVPGQQGRIQRGLRVGVLCLSFCERWQPCAPAARRCTLAADSGVRGAVRSVKPRPAGSAMELLAVRPWPASRSVAARAQTCDMCDRVATQLSR